MGGRRQPGLATTVAVRNRLRRPPSSNPPATNAAPSRPVNGLGDSHNELVPFSERSYLIYVDDSGNEDVGWIWTAIAHPLELWSDHLNRWLGFRRWLYTRHRVPADFEIHSQVWLSPEPAKNTSE